MPYDDDESPRSSRASRIARKYRAAFKKKSKELKERDTLLDELVEEHETLLESHSTAQEELGKVAASKKTEAYRKVFDEQAKKANVDPESFDDLFRLADLDIEEEEPDAKDIAQAIRDAVKKRPYMIVKTKPKGKDTESDEDDEEGADDDDDEDSNIDDDLGDEEQGDDEAPKPAKAKLKAETAPKLGKGEGSSRGGRAPIKPPSADEVIDADFSATGRSDAFRI
jgi:hypothetical protein